MTRIRFVPESLEVELNAERFYLKKWLVCLGAGISFLVDVIVTALIFWLYSNDGLGSYSVTNQGMIIILVLVSIVILCELIGTIGAFLEHRQMIRFYAGYSVGRLFIQLIGSSQIGLLNLVVVLSLTGLYTAVTIFYMLDLGKIELAKKKANDEELGQIAFENKLPAYV